MRKACCIYRIDDVTPGMDWNQFYKFLELFRKYRVVPLVGVVPDNRDPNLIVGREESAFWKIIRQLVAEGRIEVAQHGYQHKYSTDYIQPFHRLCGFKPQSEFYGLSYRLQYEKIKAGREILEKHGIPTDIWMSPGHSFDRNTVRVLKKLKFKAVTDGIGLFPVNKGGLLFVPQQVWEPVPSSMGVQTICLHLNNADEDLYRQIEAHLKSDSDIVPFSSMLEYKTLFHHSFANFAYKGVFLFNAAKNGVRSMLQSE
jgi:predicted deacetylase